MSSIRLAALFGIFVIAWVVAAAPVSVAHPRAGSSLDASSFVSSREFAIHPHAPSEWWASHGRVRSRDGRRFGFTAMFFRYSLDAREDADAAEFSLLDERTGRVVSDTRVVRKVAPRTADDGIAADDWHVIGRTERTRSREDFSVRAESSAASLRLALRPLKRASPSPAYAGYAFTRMRATGSLAIDRRRFDVVGDAWLDHEYRTTRAPVGERGSDRYELQLDNGRELTLFARRLDDGTYVVRDRSGRSEPRASSVVADGPTIPIGGRLVEADGTSRALDPDAIELVDRGGARWRSPHDGGAYPDVWRLSLRDVADTLAIEPVVRDQEVVPRAGGAPAWVGAADIARAEPPGTPLGSGYAELTGYARRQ